LEELININILGENFSFKAESGEEDAYEIAECFLSELHDLEEKISGNAMGVTKLVKLIIATMNIANKYLEVENELEEIETDLEFYIQNLGLKLK
jgi:cell division protein ZapA (FtsZ GTPase activity inhibitor)